MLQRLKEFGRKSGANIDAASQDALNRIQKFFTHGGFQHISSSLRVALNAVEPRMHVRIRS